MRKSRTLAARLGSGVKMARKLIVVTAERA
jgi:hypothetical protein